jgi:CBS-domain-containing membrane protein
MKIEKLMSRAVRACSPSDSLATAAQHMWEGDLGLVPVVDEAGRPVGVLTDRDICMSALLNGARLEEIPVARSMSRQVATVRADGSLQEALDLMRERRVRRLPVVDADGRMAGVLSIADLARSWGRHEDVEEDVLLASDLARTLADICRNRADEPTEVMVVELVPQPRSEPTGSEEKSRDRAGKPGKGSKNRGKSKRR